MKYKFFIILLCLSALMLFSSESKEAQKPQWKGEIEKKNGIKVIKNPQEPLYGEIVFELNH